ncbi:MAG: CapA family protein [Nocardioidaceae bacterium]|nr:CapA family protein [Nocardioidaceae bacterium]
MHAARTSAAGLLLALAACTAAPPPDDDAPTTAPSTSPSATPATEVPLAMLAHRGRTGRDVTAAQARAVLADGATDWSALGYDAAPMRVVTGDTGGTVGDAVEDVGSAAAAVELAATRDDTLAVVPATAAEPRVDALRVDGVDPLRSPERYAITTPADAAAEPVVTVTITGDTMLGRRVGEEIERRADPAYPLRPFADRLAAADVAFTNLESTLSQAGAAQQGGDSFGAAPSVRQGLTAAGIDVVGLANNHLGDYGATAIERTLARLDAFATVGGGRDLDEARRPAVVEHDGVRIGFVATDSIGETPAATATRPGTNRIDAPPRTGPLDRAQLDRVAADVRALDAEVDAVVVVPHWGTQYTHRPEQSQRQMARAFADAGADLVVGGHPHWVQGWETIGAVPVVHSLGNFVFDMDFSRQTQEGIVLEAVFWGGRLVALDPVPYVIGDDLAPRPVTGERAASILRDVRSESRAPYDRLR